MRLAAATFGETYQKVYDLHLVPEKSWVLFKQGYHTTTETGSIGKDYTTTADEYQLDRFLLNEIAKVRCNDGLYLVYR